jgi:hypothetical protein
VEKLKVHAFYVILILVLIIILLATVHWAGIRDLAQYLNFGATLTSMVLALVAIIYAFVSNSSAGERIGALRSVASEVSETARAMTATAARLDTQIASLPELVKDVGAKVTETYDAVTSLKEATERPTSGAASSAPSPTPASPIYDACADKVADRVLDKGSLMGHWILYAASIAFTKKIGFDLAELSKDTALSSDYCHGWLLASEHGELLTITEARGILSVTDFNSHLLKKIRESTLAVEERFRREGKGAAETLGGVAKIDSFFGIAPEAHATPAPPPAA